MDLDKVRKLFNDIIIPEVISILNKSPDGYIFNILLSRIESEFLKKIQKYFPTLASTTFEEILEEFLLKLVEEGRLFLSENGDTIFSCYAFDLSFYQKRAKDYLRLSNTYQRASDCLERNDFQLFLLEQKNIEDQMRKIQDEDNGHE